MRKEYLLLIPTFLATFLIKSFVSAESSLNKFQEPQKRVYKVQQKDYINYEQFSQMLTIEDYNKLVKMRNETIIKEARTYWKIVMAERPITTKEILDYKTKEWYGALMPNVSKALGVGEGVVELRDKEGNHFFGLEGKLYLDMITAEEYSIIEKKRFEKERWELRDILLGALRERPHNSLELNSIIPKELMYIRWKMGIVGILEGEGITTKIDPSEGKRDRIYYGLTERIK